MDGQEEQQTQLSVKTVSEVTYEDERMVGTRDAQGSKIQTFGHRDVSITLQSLDEREVILKERVTFSDVVNQPILSILYEQDGRSTASSSACSTVMCKYR